MGLKISHENINEPATTVATTMEENNDLFSLGDVAFWKCEYEKAKEYFQAVLNQSSVSPLDLARCYKSLGAVNTKLANYEEALHSYHKQLDILKKLKISNDEEADIVKCYMSIGLIYFLQYDYVQALDYYKQALTALSDPNTAPDLVSNIYKNLANLYTKRTEFDSALSYFEKALEIDRNHLREDHPKFGQTYANIGAMYNFKQDYKQALDYFIKARETWLKSVPSSRIHIESMEKTIRTVQSKIDELDSKAQSLSGPPIEINESKVVENSKISNDPDVHKNISENYEGNHETEIDSLKERVSLIWPNTTHQGTQSDSGLDSDKESITDTSSEQEETEDEENLEEYSLLWCDRDLNSTEENCQTQVELRKTINFLRTFETVEDCRAYAQRSVDKTIILIVSESLGQELVPQIHHLKQVVAIYIYCTNSEEYDQWPNNYDKIKHVVTTTDEIVERISEDQKKRNIIQEEELPISIFKPTFASIQSTDHSLRTDFMWSHLFMESILRIDNDSRQVAFDGFLDSCRHQYAGNNVALAQVNELERNYNPEDVIKWYTRDCFLYRILNKAFRQQDIDKLLRFRFFIQDLHEQLEELMKQGHFEKPFIRLYRGKRMSVEVLQKLKTSDEKYVCINSFLSTTVDRQVALVFAGGSQDTDGYTTPVLVEIELDTQLKGTKPFASISHRSDFPDMDEEILFMPSTVFKIFDVSRSEKESVWTVKMKLVDEEESNLKPLFQAVKREIEEETTLVSVIKILGRIGKYNEAEKCYKRLLSSLKEDDPNLSKCYSGLGAISREKGDYDSAYSYYKKALEFNLKLLPLGHVVIAENYMNIGLVLKDKNNYAQALEYLVKASNWLLRTEGHDNLKIATVDHSIGNVYVELGRYHEALLYLHRCLQIQKRLIPYIRPETASVLNNIGVAYYMMHDYDLALENYDESLSIRLVFKENPLDTADTYNNIGIVYATGFNDYGQAIKNFEKSLEILQSILPTNHPSITNTQNIIERTRRFLGNK